CFLVACLWVQLCLAWGYCSVRLCCCVSLVVVWLPAVSAAVVRFGSPLPRLGVRARARHRRSAVEPVRGRGRVLGALRRGRARLAAPGCGRTPGPPDCEPRPPLGRLRRPLRGLVARRELGATRP